MYIDAVSAQGASEAVPRAGLYARISRDRSGDELGVRRQISECEKLAKTRGFVVEATYIDNDTSAYAGRSRPQYERLLDDVRNGRIEALVAWHPDRLYRHPRDLERFVETIEAAGAAVATVQAGELDLSNPSGRMVARMLGAAARYEGEHKAARQRSKHRERAEAGLPGGGGDRPFGYEEDRVTIRLGEAAEIRKAARHVIDGGTLRSIVLDWSARGISTPRGGTWTKTSLRRMLGSARIAGLRTYRGQMIGKAKWKGIITPEAREALVATFSDPSRRAKRPSRRYLLTGGLLRCKRCGAAMVARPNAEGARRYACAKDFGGCNGTFVIAEPLEDLVREAVFAALDGPTLTRLRQVEPEPDDGLATEVLSLEERRRDLADAYARGTLSVASFEAADRDIEGRLAEVRGRLAVRSAEAFVTALPSNAEALSAWWENADLDRRKQLLGVVLKRVEIGGAVVGRTKFDPERIGITWRA
jgi:DNA invertase Pin-like site-specific DNA recombinase